MGIMKRIQMERDEREYNERLRETEEFLADMHRQFPREGWNQWDAETYEAFMEALDKDD